MAQRNPLTPETAIAALSIASPGALHVVVAPSSKRADDLFEAIARLAPKDAVIDTTRRSLALPNDACLMVCFQSEQLRGATIASTW